MPVPMVIVVLGQSLRLFTINRYLFATDVESLEDPSSAPFLKNAPDFFLLSLRDFYLSKQFSRCFGDP